MAGICSLFSVEYVSGVSDSDPIEQRMFPKEEFSCEKVVLLSVNRLIWHVTNHDMHVVYCLTWL